jgi:orotidine-5'-phosphate decarboxylase
LSTGLIVALDNPDLDKAEDLAKQLSGRVAALKVGLTLFTAHGPDAATAIGAHAPVFCDLKLHDIPHQVGLAAAELTRLGVWMFTVHASGGPVMIKAAVQAAAKKSPPPLVAAVTMLTSLSGQDARDIGFSGDPASLVRKLGRLAVDAGASALVCSPQELALLRADLGPELVLVTPGVRPAGSPAGDQSRVMTPAEAARAGASYVVVGRPVTDDPDPAEAAAAIVKELLGNG